MKINILGAGPAGLYAAILLKQVRADIEIHVVDQNPEDATFGFGVVFSDQALAFLQADDPETAALVEPHMRRWSDIVIAHRTERLAIDGVGFAGIGRLELLRVLLARARGMGIEPLYETRIDHLDDLPPADLIIGADGLHSTVRRAHASAFGESIKQLNNWFVWYGANCQFDALTQTFIDTPFGPMNAHHYAYAPGKATFIIEMTPATYAKTGFANKNEPQYRAECERLFGDHLRGATLIPNKSVWRQFPLLTCERWFSDRCVLVGDALHSAHFSIGSGTRLALEDVIALVKSLQSNDWNIDQALPAYQGTRQPIVEKITHAAHRSAAWYEDFEQHMALDPWRFALSYIRRAGRLDAQRLRSMAPAFTAALQAKGIDLESAK